MSKLTTPRATALEMDDRDALSAFKFKFHIPKRADGSQKIYFCGNSLGLQPTTTPGEIDQELDKWREYVVDGWFKPEEPWVDYHAHLNRISADIVGAKPAEVVVMNTLTVNLHLMMVSFYRPEGKRRKILIEDTAFPSDSYAVRSQIAFHGGDPDSELIRVAPEAGNDYVETEQFLEAIAQHKDELALVLLGAVNYYSGQFYDCKAIGEATHQAGAVYGLDCAHAAGNAPLKLHDWDVDFAVWCNYKYLNSGPGAVASAFVHEKHAKDFDGPRFAGWWGNDPASRFEMTPAFRPAYGADGWMISTPPILAMAPIRASLQIFDDAGFDRLRAKSVQLTGFFEQLLHDIDHPALKIITPEVPDRRGCQLSLVIDEVGKPVFDALDAAGIIGDWREPDVIRLAPTPLYNSFQQVYDCAEIIGETLDRLA